MVGWELTWVAVCVVWGCDLSLDFLPQVWCEVGTEPTVCVDALLLVTFWAISEHVWWERELVVVNASSVPHETCAVVVLLVRYI